MTIYRFYLKTKNKGHTEYGLYAITNKKKIAKEFRETRNMKRFIEKSSDDMDKDEWIEIANDNRGMVLDHYELETRGYDENDKPKVKKIKILMTLVEYQNATDEEEFMTYLSAFFESTPFYLIFKENMVDALRWTEYVASQRFYSMDEYEIMELLKYITDSSNTYNFEFEEESVTYDDGDYAAPEIRLDEFGRFLDMYYKYLA